MTGYFSEIWRLRHFWMALVRIDLRKRVSAIGDRHRLVLVAPDRHDGRLVRRFQPIVQPVDARASRRICCAG